MQKSLIVDGVFAGKLQPMPNDGRPTGIFKLPVAGPMRIEREGLVDDQQADRRVHGGPEKAIHHFPQDHFRRFIAYFREDADKFVPGCMGENVSTLGWTENDVCIGDVFRLGSARVQLSQPRSPCWKIEAKHDVEGLMQCMDEQGVSGWYYRVLEPGQLQAGDTIELLDRNAEPLTLREYWNLKNARRPPLDRVRALIATPGFNEGQRQRWQARLDWLEKNG